MSLSVCVYCGSRPGADPAHARAAREVGAAVAARGWQLVYGGGRAGLMGEVADAALTGGARVVGVIPRSLIERELGHPGLAELHVVETMHQRKLLMAERSDAFVALPGGIGTLEELFETWSWRQLGYHGKPLGLFNCAGYYDPLLGFLDRTREAGFMGRACRALIEVESDTARLLDRIAALAREAGARDDYRAI